MIKPEPDWDGIWCRVEGCCGLATEQGNWLHGDEKGMLVGYCNKHSRFRDLSNYAKINPLLTKADFLKELNE